MGINLTTEYHSPLRYPGGKGRLAPYFQLMMQYNNLSGGHYVEPYAGGASVALSLLYDEFASEVHINDFDYRIFCFWKCCMSRTDELVELIHNTPVNMDTWRDQREIRRNPKKYKQLEIAFSTFFLNRTNRSGILKAGVIGGNDQSGEWKIDARYNKGNLIQRIERVGRYAECIHLYNEDAVTLTERLRKTLPKKTLFYFDPPYYNKGKELYINFYEHEDHVHIAKAVGKIKKQNWVVSYDNDSNIKCLYDKYLQQTYDLNYSAGKTSVGSEVIMFSDKLIVPKVDNPAEKKELKYFDTHGLFAEWHEMRG